MAMRFLPATNTRLAKSVAAYFALLTVASLGHALILRKDDYRARGFGRWLLIPRIKTFSLSVLTPLECMLSHEIPTYLRIDNLLQTNFLSASPRLCVETCLGDLSRGHVA